MKLASDIFYKITNSGILITSCNHEKVYQLKDIEEKIFLAFLSNENFHDNLSRLAEEDDYNVDELCEFAEKFLNELQTLKIII